VELGGILNTFNVSPESETRQMDTMLVTAKVQINQLLSGGFTKGDRVSYTQASSRRNMGTFMYFPVACELTRGSVEFRVPSARAIEQNVVFVGARHKHLRIHEENGSNNVLLLD
jgi:hypothetical protein